MVEVAEAMMMEVMRVVLVEVEVVLMALLVGMLYWWIYCSDNVIVVITAAQKDSSQPLPSWLRWKMDPVGPHTVATGRPGSPLTDQGYKENRVCYDAAESAIEPEVC